MSKIVLGTSLLAKRLGEIGGWEVLGGKTLIPFDFTNIKTYAIWIAEHDTVINCMDYEDYSGDPLKKLKMMDLNIGAVNRLVDYCNLTYKKIVHISSTDVSKSNPRLINEPPSNKENWYAYSKLMGEGSVVFNAKDYLVVRTFFKDNPRFYDYPVTDTKNKILADHIAKSIYHMVEDDYTGLRVEKTTPYDIIDDVCVYSKMGEYDLE